MARRALFVLFAPIATAAACSAMVSSELEGLPSESEQQTTQGTGADGGGGALATSTTGSGGSGGEPPSLPPLPCGATMCTGGDTCCVPWTNPAGAYCATDCQANETEIHCHDDSFCDDWACCAYVDIGFNTDPADDRYLSITCAPTCPPGIEISTTQERPMCVQPSDCASGECLSERKLPDAYKYCQATN